MAGGSWRSHDLVQVSWMKLAMTEQRRVVACMEVKMEDAVGDMKSEERNEDSTETGTRQAAEASGPTKQALTSPIEYEGSRFCWCQYRGLQGSHAEFYRARRHLQRQVTARRGDARPKTHSGIPALSLSHCAPEAQARSESISMTDAAGIQLANQTKELLQINWIRLIFFFLKHCQVSMIHWPTSSFRTDAPARHHKAALASPKRQLSPVPL